MVMAGAGIGVHSVFSYLLFPFPWVAWPLKIKGWSPESIVVSDVVLVTAPI